MTVHELQPTGLTATYEPVDWSPPGLPEDPDEGTGVDEECGSGHRR